uniref:LysM peptidoglycan-binding domain-containing protein n=1 Tax=Roseivirga sp. TaxID=1964215 RepID=UPI004048979C
MENANLPYVHVVQAGDTLPDLCNLIYSSPSYYVQVAKYNGLNKFRSLKPGTQLIFPPIVTLE